MPRDQRLYMTFPIDFDEHPKIELLSDSAFRTFVAMNGYSRRQRLDGSIPEANALKRWKVRDLTELTNSHPERPLVVYVDGFYVIRSYADHQFTTADETELHEKRASAGAKGGKAKALATALAKQTVLQNVAGSGLGIETGKTDDGDPRPILTEVDAGEADETEFISAEAKLVGIRSLPRVQKALERVVGGITQAQAIDLTRAVTLLAAAPVKSVEAYIEAACVNSPDEIRSQWAGVAA